MLFIRKKLKKATKEDDERLGKALSENKVGFKDAFAMVFSAFLVIVLPCLLVLLAFAGVIMLLFSLF